MENVELVPAICPNCGAKLQLPDNLTKAHCIYCGNEFIISEKKPDIHYHMGERIGTIENYIKLAISSINAGDMAKAKEYFNKAREIHLDDAEKLMNEKSEEIAIAYLSLSLVKSREIKKAPIYSESMYGNNYDTIKIFTQKATIAWENGISFIPNDRDDLKSRAWVIAAEIKKPEIEGPFRYSSSFIKAIKSDSKTCLHKALEYNPDNKDAISMLKELGEFCKVCNGSKKCPSCKGSGLCDTCGGTGSCPKCGGSGKVSGLFGKEKSCKKCGGSGTCPTCNGAKICKTCKGKKICPSCKGRGL